MGDDLIEVEGDGAEFGYGFVPQRQQAFKLVRTVVEIHPSLRRILPQLRLPQHRL